MFNIHEKLLLLLVRFICMNIQLSIMLTKGLQRVHCLPTDKQKFLIFACFTRPLFDLVWQTTHLNRESSESEFSIQLIRRGTSTSGLSR